MKNLRSLLLWSIIAAAFIGPGTVTTATKAGAAGSWAYVWPVCLAGLAGFVLMEMAARVTAASDLSLGQLVRGRGWQWLAWPLFIAVGIGCAAYESGNLLGGLKGMQLIQPLAKEWVLLLGLLAGLLLYTGNIKRISQYLAVIVALMGLSFLYTGWVASGKQLISEAVDTEAAIIVGLLGTTIVPYNFFIAAGLGKGQRLGEMRLGLGISFGLGILITLGILLTGGLLTEFTDFAALADVLQAELGSFGKWMLALGLAAAGLSSAITAPLALALAGQSLLGKDRETWQNEGRWFRLSWLLCLCFGLAVALFDFNIVAVIFSAQLINGLFLPFIAGLVLLLANDQKRLGLAANHWWQNLLGGAIFLYLCWQNFGAVVDLLNN
ncbi:MAG: divalent metal cation transporter [Bacteroidota bacterium]